MVRRYLPQDHLFLALMHNFKDEFAVLRVDIDSVAIAEVQRDMPFREARAQAIDLNLDDVAYLIPFERVEDDDFVDTVDELGTQTLFAQALAYNALHVVFIHALELTQPGCADVAGHDNDRVLEVNGAALPIGETPIIENLQQDIEHIRRGLFDFVEQHDAVGAAAHSLGQLPALFITNIAGGCANQAGDAVFLHVLGHVDTNQSMLIVEEEFGEGASQFGFTNAGWPQEHEAGKRAIRVL